MDGVDIHGIWINLGALVSRDVVLLNGVGVVGLFVGNDISSFPLGFKVDCVDEPPHQIRSYTLLFSLFLHFPYIADPPLRTSALTRLHVTALVLARQLHSLYRTDLAYLMDI